MPEHKEIVWPDIQLTDYMKEIRTGESIRYENNPGNFFNAWEYVNNHPIFWFIESPEFSDVITWNWGFGSTAVGTSLRRRKPGVAPAVDVDVALVNDEGEIDDDEDKNVHTEVWLEAGPFSLYPRTEHGATAIWHMHDIDLDCGASTYEQAVITLARLIWGKYGNDRRVADKEN